MRIDDPNDTNPYADQFDGGAATDAEAALIAEGLDDEGEEDGDTDSTDADAAAEAARAAKEAADAAEAQAAADAAAAAAAAKPIPQAQIPAKPEAPKDFAAELLALEEKYEAGDLTVVEFNRATRELTMAEVDYKNSVAAWQQQADTITAQNAQAVTDDWDKACVAFEAANADFLGNPLRHTVMQNAIAHVEKAAQAAGEQLTSQQVLDKALAIAHDYTGYKPPAKVDTAADDKKKIDEAVGNRKQGAPGKTLGDVPQSKVESTRGDASDEALDALPIDELEVAFANMTPAQQEKFLRTAPGANANGRG